MFSESDYKYGNAYGSLHGTSGFPPALGSGIRVCDDIWVDTEKYIEVAQEALRMIRKLTAGHIPETNLISRTPSSISMGFCWDLCLQTYYLQEFVPGGRDHPLYAAVTQKKFADFVAAVESLAGKPTLV